MWSFVRVDLDLMHSHSGFNARYGSLVVAVGKLSNVFGGQPCLESFSVRLYLSAVLEFQDADLEVGCLFDASHKIF